MATPQQKWSYYYLIFIYNLIVFIPKLSDSMTLCEYYSNLGIYKPECFPMSLTNNNIEEEVEDETPHYPQPQQSTVFQFSFHRLPSIYTESEQYKSSENEVQAVFPEYEEFGLCRGFFHSCYESDKCESGTICSQMQTTKQCCTDPGHGCPSPTELGFNCKKINPTSW